MIPPHSLKTDKRRHLRYSFPYTVEYVLNPNTTDEIFKGVLLNISNSGLCLCIFNHLAEGQKITIKSIIPTPCQKATVRWVKKFNNDSYIAGLMFCNDFY